MLQAALRDPQRPGQAQVRVLLEEAPRSLLLDLVTEGFVNWAELAQACRAVPHLGGRNVPWIEEMAGLSLAEAAQTDAKIPTKSAPHLQPAPSAAHPHPCEPVPGVIARREAPWRPRATAPFRNIITPSAPNHVPLIPSEARKAESDFSTSSKAGIHSTGANCSPS